MYPYFVLGLSHEATPQEITARYNALVERFAPDVAPEQFALVRAAYEALRTDKDRIRTRLFGLDTGQLEVSLLDTLALKRERMRPDELASWLQALDEAP